MYPVAIIGTGFADRVLIPAFKHFPECPLVGVSSRKLETATAIADRQGIAKPFTDWRKMIEETKPKIVVMALPAPIQYQILKEILPLPVAILCEKPLSVNASQADELLVLWKQNPKPVMVDFEFPDSPLWKEAKTALSELGKVRELHVEWTNQTVSNRDRLIEWKSDSSQGGGALALFGSHVLYNLEWFQGPIDSLSARLFSKPGDQRPTETGFEMTVRFKSGLEAKVKVDTDRADLLMHRWDFKGATGRLVFENPGRDYIGGFRIQGRDKPNSDGGSKDGRVVAVEGVIRKLLNWIQTGEKQSPSIEDAHRIQHWMEAARRSSQTGKAVHASTGSDVGHHHPSL